MTPPRTASASPSPAPVEPTHADVRRVLGLLRASRRSGAVCGASIAIAARNLQGEGTPTEWRDPE